MPVLGLDHVQLAMPVGEEERAVAFYAGILGIPEVPKPRHLAARGGCWFESGHLKIHLGVETPFRPAGKAHPAFIVDDLAPLIARLEAGGYPCLEDQPLDSYHRCYVHDPFGNRIELMQESEGPVAGAS